MRLKIFYGVIVIILFLIITAVISVINTRKPINEFPTLPTPTTIPFPTALPTISYTPTSFPTDMIMQKQTEADREVGLREEAKQSNYPWYNNLPLRSATYFVYFDLDKKVFIGKLYPKTTGSSSIDEQTNAMKQEILTKLKGLGIETSTYQFEWSVTPES